MHIRTSPRIAQLRVPDGAGDGLSTKDADRRVRAACGPDVLDTTHFDTVAFPVPPYALDIFSRAARDGALAYTPYRGHSQVLEVVAQSVSRLLGVPVDPDSQVLLTPGTQAALFAALSSLVGDGTRVIVPTPEYVFDERILGFLGADIVTVPLSVDDHGARLDLAALEAAAVAGPAVLLLSHPNNPTGAVYPRPVMEQVARIAREHDLVVIVDQLYARLLHGDTELVHLAVLPGMAERCVTLLGPSKTESLSGYRIGVAVAPAWLVDTMEDVLAVTALRAPGYAQHVLTGWLTQDEQWLAERLEVFTRLRQMTVERLRTLPWLRVHPQDGTAYVFPDVSALGLPDVVVAERLARDADVLVSPGYHFGPGGNGHFRLCYARDEAEWDKALDRIVRVLGDLAREQHVGVETLGSRA
jgi:aspartate/methionine/tyrosine aminotransferase